MNRLFVYGTLKKGLHVRGSKNLGAATASGTLYDVSWFPGVRFDQPAENPVQGVVFDIEDGFAADAWANLDRYEGVPVLYTREIVPVTLESGETLDCYAYQINERACHPEDVIASGVWEGKR